MAALVVAKAMPASAAGEPSSKGQDAAHSHGPVGKAYGQHRGTWSVVDDHRGTSMFSVVERLNTPLAVVLILVFFIALDGLLFYLYQ